MRKALLLLMMVLGAAYICAAQPGNGRGGRFQRIEGLRVAYISQQLQLTVQEAEKFWPVYNQYLSEIRAARQANMKDELAFDEAALQVRKNYKQQFLRLLGTEVRANQVYGLERNFRAVLRKELEQRQQGNMGNRRMPPPPPRDQSF